MEEQVQWWLQQLLLGVLLVAAAAALLLFQRRRSTKRLPPGPRGLPVLGNLLLFTRSQRWHADFYKLADTYGPIMWLRMGSQATVMVQSAELAMEILKHQDTTFASRPRLGYGGDLVFNKGKNVGLSPYGPGWTFMRCRKLMTAELLTHKRISDFQHVREEEVGNMVEAIRGHLGQPVDLDYLVTTVNLNNITRMGMSKAAISRYQVQDPQQHKAAAGKGAGNGDGNSEVGNGNSEAEEEELISIVKEAGRMLGVRGIGDAIPWLSFLDNFLLPKAKLQQTKRQLDAFYARVIQEHRQHRSAHPGQPARDFVDVLLDVSSESDAGSAITNDVITAQLQEMILGGTGTSGATVVWAMAELLRHPDEMERAAEELDRVVGASRAVSGADVVNLPFLQAVVKETLRLHPPLPLMVPHYSMQPATVAGYHVPANTTVMFNVWGLGRDPAYWARPHEFQPGRFLQADVDLRGHHFELLPFGSGKRMCPGLSLGLSVVSLSLATLVHSFSWTLPPDVARPEDLDMTERQGLIVHKALGLHAVPHAKRAPPHT